MVVSPSRDQIWRQRLQWWAGVGEEPEDSKLLRVLVQALVAVGIVAVLAAAVGVTPTAMVNLAAVPLSALGGYWSWRSRRRANITAKFIIALGMLVALGIFLAQLLGRGGDTRVLLAELLIHLLVCHSFDMPRRKDLGYSMVIALILLGVAATISQTLTLAPLVVIFLAIALPVLILDYRSRLGLKGWQRSTSPKSGSGLRRLGLLLISIVLLGLVIFALLPRFPGYQVRNFPVSSPIEFQGEFRGNEIARPGQGQDNGDEEGAQGQGDGEVGPGQMDDTYYYGFSRTMNQNLRGAMTPQVMLRVRSQSVGFWRVMAFDQYTGQGWTVSDQDRVEVIPRSGPSFQIFLPSAAYRPGFQETALADLREIIQTYTVVNSLQNVVPALYQARQLYFPTREVAIDTEGGLRAPVLLLPGLTYTVISQVPYRDRTALRQAETDYPDPFRALYLQMPEELRAPVRQTAEELLARSPEPITAPSEIALFLAQTLKQTYTLQPELPFFEAEEDLVNAFLYRYNGGYADHFPTVLTVMLRSLGIPARMVVGFAPGQFNPFTGYYEVRNTDAYAMTEVFFPGYGWFAFDPIPGHEVVPPSIRDGQTFGVVRQFWNWVAGWLPSPVAGMLNQTFSWLGEIFGRLWAFLSGGWLQALGGLLALTGAGLGLWWGWLGWRQWQHHRWLQRLPMMERLYQQMVAWLATQGFPKPPAQTPLEHAHRYHHSQAPHGPVVVAVTTAYVQWRYGGQPQDVETLAAQVRSLLKHRSSTKKGV